MTWYMKKFGDLTTEELYSIIQLRIAVFVVEQKCAYQEVDGYDLEAIHMYSKEGETITSYARLIPSGIKMVDASIGRVIVHRDYRGQQLGHRLIEKCITTMQETWGTTSITIQAQAHLSEFYGVHGFEAISDVYNEDGIPHVDMQWKQLSSTNNHS